MRTHLIEHYQAFRKSVPCLSRAAKPPEKHQIGARKRRAPLNTILSQPYRRRHSTDRLNREGSQLTASLEGEPGPTPAGKTLPHAYPDTNFRREKVGIIYINNIALIVLLVPSNLPCPIELIDWILTQVDVKKPARGHNVKKHHPEGEKTYDVPSIQRENGNCTKILGKSDILPIRSIDGIFFACL